MQKKAKIVVVGSFISDITAFVPHFPREGETVIGSSLNFGPGGKGSNQATAAARSGAEVVMVAKTGDDTLSDIQHKHYLREGMTEKYIFRTKESQTGTCFISVSEVTGQNEIVIVKGANEHLSPEDVLKAEEDISTCDCVLAQFETTFETVEMMIRLAKKHHKVIVINPAPAQAIPEGLLDGVDYFTPNETEAEFFSGIPVVTEEDARKASEKIIGLGVKNVIITLGKKGAYFYNKKRSFLVKPTNLKAVDSTGAGDAFNGALVVALSEGRDVEDAIKFANCVASISVTRKGSSDSMPFREESLALLHDFYGVDF